MVAKTPDTLKELYLADETAWLDAMANLIRAGSHEDLDFANLAEFLADNAARDRWEVYCKLLGLLSGLLVWNHLHEKLSPSRRSEILGKQFEFETWVDTLTLRKHAEAILEETYADAIRSASAEAEAASASFPGQCPWTVAQLLTDEVFNFEAEETT